ncbi:hypothetical protein K491DRAFT_43578 [Lophiostoma macrostomum CBS 122681]|uniref:Uncharacterized protein n=1 Tax=Lophiostoma macrostomum CBS 122681 TaxID=1314788 RepID=A0A6A6T218_9PLEO|nr:hypothetical protein K491DRAFT_43578 [Lophiostoma macrostomum CBS 122681]
MFGRKRAASNASAKNPPSASASLAATKAFIRDRESNVTLSSAAAAAALHKHPASPTPVGATITKRMARRGSTSSHGSGSQRAPELQRHSSSGSMTERSFRAPSPGRGSPAVDTRDAPPVPSVPREVPSVGVVHRRASSLDPQPRGGSNAARQGGRGVSLDRGGTASPRPGQRVMSLSQVPENEQDGSSRLVNFSRPISPPQQSYSPTPPRAGRGGHSGWFAAPVANPELAFRGSPARPKTSSGVTQFDLHNAQHAVQEAANKPTSSKRIQSGVEGARLSSGSMRAKPRGTAVSARQSHAPTGPVDPNSPNAVYDPSTRKFIHKQAAMERFRSLNQDDEKPTHQYVAAQPAPPRVRSPPQERVVQQPAPIAFREARARTPSPPRQHAQRHVHQEAPEEAPAPPPAPIHFEPVEQSEDGDEDEDDDEEPATPPRVQTGGILARQTSEDVAAADVRPAPTAERNDLKIDPLGGRKAALESPVSPKISGNQDSPYPRLGVTAITSPTDNLVGKGRGSVQGDRTHSLSPPRNAHFAARALEVSDGVLHQPPPRSVSPAKSALKSSPSVSRRNSSPLTSNGRVLSKGAPSEGSDNVSDDGRRKKKKSVRVSFDEDPVIAGTSAYSDEPMPSPMGLSQSRWNTSSEVEHLEDVMQPRPALPSFGSIRDKNRRQSEGEVPEKVTETVSSSLSTSVGSIGDSLEASSDHAVGSILAQDFAAKSAPQTTHQDPLPPEVTSVEGSGYVSDSESSDGLAPEAVPEKSRDVPTDQTLPEPKTLATPAENVPLQQPAEVPMIALLPATPSATEEKPEPKFQRPFVPGGWDEDEETEPEEAIEPIKIDIPVSAINSAPQGTLAALKAEEDSSSEDNSSIYSDAYEELTDNEDGGFASLDAIVQSPIVASSSGPMRSKHADPGLTEPQASSLRNEYTGVTKKDPPPPPTDDWDATRQHWSGLIDARKQQEDVVVDPAPPPVLAESPIPKAKAKEKAKTKKATPAIVPSSPQAVFPKVKPAPKSERTPPKAPSAAPQASAQPRKSALKKTTASVPPAPSQQSQQPQLKKTMRGSSAPPAQPAPETHMRKSMRSGPPESQSQPGMRTSMRSGEPSPASRAASGLAASRHSMPPIEPRAPKGALQKRNIPAAAPATRNPRPQSAGGKPMAIAPTYDSDSDASASSFRRERARPSRDGRYTMRSSMRSGPTPTMREAPSMRPSSPPATKSPPPAALRKSMRPSSPTPEPPAGATRSSRFSIRSLSPKGGFRPSKTSGKDAPPLPTQTSSPRKTTGFAKQAQPKKSTPIAKSRFSSRFADSSDEEDEARPSRFQSRFADSDDDESFELPPGLTPVRGIPRRAGDDDADSTDLEDEASDDEATSSRPARKDIEKSGQLTNGATAGEGTSLAAGSLRQSKHAPELPSFEAGKKTKSRRGFFGLGKKKKPVAEPAGTSIEPVTNGEPDIPLPPEHKERAQERSSRPLTPIGEDDKSVEETSPTQRAPKLQRRSTPQWGRSTSDSWPLPQPPTIGEDARPQSSDGIVGRRTSLRPTLGKRNTSQVSQSHSIVDPNTGRSVSFGRTGKKKKFQGLRRVFGLND